MIRRALRYGADEESGVNVGILGEKLGVELRRLTSRSHVVRNDMFKETMTEMQMELVETLIGE